MMIDFQALLIQARAREPRSKRGKWGCPVCGKLRVSVNLDRRVYHCFTAGCAFSGNIMTLARHLGLKVDSVEWRKKAAETATRLEYEERGNALRSQAYQNVAKRFLATMRVYGKVRGATLENSNQSDLLENGLNLYADLLGLSAELLLLETLPVVDVCRFISAPEPTRQEQIMEVVSRDGLWVEGKFFELPPVVSAQLTAGVSSVPIPEEKWSLVRTGTDLKQPTPNSPHNWRL